MENFQYSVQLSDQDWAEFSATADECGLLQASLASGDEPLSSDIDQGDSSGSSPPGPLPLLSGQLAPVGSCWQGCEEEDDVASRRLVSRSLCEPALAPGPGQQTLGTSARSRAWPPLGSGATAPGQRSSLLGPALGHEMQRLLQGPVPGPPGEPPRSPEPTGCSTTLQRPPDSPGPPPRSPGRKKRRTMGAKGGGRVGALGPGPAQLGPLLPTEASLDEGLGLTGPKGKGLRAGTAALTAGAGQDRLQTDSRGAPELSTRREPDLMLPAPDCVLEGPAGPFRAPVRTELCPSSTPVKEVHADIAMPKPDVTLSTPASEPQPNMAGSAPASEPQHDVAGSTPTSKTEFNVAGSIPTSEPQPDMVGSTPASKTQPDVAGSTPASKTQPDMAGSTPASEPQPGVAGSTPASEPQPGVAGSTPASEPQPDVAGSTPASEPQPGMAGSTPASKSQPDVAGSTPASKTQPDVAGSTPASESKLDMDLPTACLVVKPEDLPTPASVAALPTAPPHSVSEVESYVGVSAAAPRANAAAPSPGPSPQAGLQTGGAVREQATGAPSAEAPAQHSGGPSLGPAPGPRRKKVRFSVATPSPGEPGSGGVLSPRSPVARTMAGGRRGLGTWDAAAIGTHPPQPRILKHLPPPAPSSPGGSGPGMGFAVTLPEAYEFFFCDTIEEGNEDTEEEAVGSQALAEAQWPDMCEFFFRDCGSQRPKSQQGSPAAPAPKAEPVPAPPPGSPVPMSIPEAYEHFFGEDRCGGVLGPSSPLQLHTLEPPRLAPWELRPGPPPKPSPGAAEQLSLVVRQAGELRGPLTSFTFSQKDMCLVFVAFATWAVRTSDLQTPDAWKTVLLANIGTISAIRYFRRQVGQGRSSPSPSPSPSSSPRHSRSRSPSPGRSPSS